MIVVDTSALMALLLGEPEAGAIDEALQQSDRIILSGATLAEALIVARKRGIEEEMRALIDGLGIEVDTVNAATARQVADAYAAFGKAVHPAGLNFGDCFAYASARELDLPLLFVGNDFSKTDIEAALAP